LSGLASVAIGALSEYIISESAWGDDTFDYSAGDTVVDFGLGAFTLGLDKYFKGTKLGYRGLRLYATHRAAEATLDAGSELIRAGLNGQTLGAGDLLLGTGLNFLIGEGGNLVAKRFGAGGIDLRSSRSRNVPGGLPHLPRSVGAAAGEIQLTSRIGGSRFAVRQAERLGQAVQRDVDNLVAALRAGNINPGIGTRALGNNFFELRGANAGRVIVKKTGAGSFDIVGKFQGHARGDAANSAIIQRLISDYAP